MKKTRAVGERIEANYLEINQNILGVQAKENEKIISSLRLDS